MARASKRPASTALRLLLVALLSIAGTAVVTLPASPVFAASCGEILVKGSDWLGGGGVDVRSNGQYQNTGTECKPGGEVYNLSANPPQYGYGWQCVELVNRLYNTKGWSGKLILTGGAAKNLYSDAANGKFAHLTAHANGSGYKPVPGDIIVHSNGTYGHVAVVDSVSGGTLHSVEENASGSGRNSYAYNGATGAASRSGVTISGYVHSDLNKAATSASGSTGSYQAALQANTGNLWVAGTAGTGDQRLGMMRGTSPSTTKLTTGAYAVAFQANTGNLWVTGATGTRDLGLGMMAGTSPSIAALPNGGWQVAFQANTGNLWVAGTAGTGDQRLGMMTGTSPSITGVSGGWQAAFQANTGNLWVAGAAGTRDLGLGMMTGTSPAIA